MSLPLFTGSSDMQITYKNKPIEKCSRVELFEVIKSLSDMRQQQYSYRESKRNEELEMELRIKNKLIQDLVKK